MKNLLKNLRKDKKGATAIEYALIAGFIAIVIIAAVTGLGSTLNQVFVDINTSLANATN